MVERRLTISRALVVACIVFGYKSSTVLGASPIHVLKVREAPKLNSCQVAGVIAAEQPRHEQLEHAACEEARRAIDHDTTMTPGLQVLRGGFGVIGISGGNNIKSSSSQSNLGAGGGVALGGSGTSASSGASTPRGGTAFTKIVYSKVPGEIPKTVEVAGSWSKFKQRNSMTKNAQGDFEIIMELPRGQHEVKFVINGDTWRCHPDLETRRDSHGNQNNIIHVDNVARPTSASGQAPKRENTEVFVPQKSSIDIARDVVNRLEQEKKTAQEKLAKAHQQLVQTLVEELTAGVVSLEKSKKLVSGFNETGATGLKSIRQAGEAKMTEIRAHMAKIRQILDQKEQIALDTVENDMKKRLGVLSSEVSLFSSVIPELNTILEQTQKALKMSQSDSQTFIAQANALVATIQDKTHKAAALSPPTDNADFENLSLNLLPPGS